MNNSTVVVPAPTNPSAGWFRLRRRLQKRQTQRTIVNLAAILVIAVFIQTKTGVFFTTGNLDNLGVQISVTVVLACAMTLVMVAGGIDVSIVGIVSLSGVVAAMLTRDGVPIWVAFIIAVLAGLVVGMLNSILCVTIGITSLIATIGTLYVSQGVANLLTGGIPVAQVPTSFNYVGTGFLINLPVSVWIIVVVVAIFVAVQRWTVLGRHTVAAGSNPQASFLNGISVGRIQTICFLISGAAAGWGGIMYSSRIGTAIPNIDNNLLFRVIVACVVGGTSLLGGEGSVFGSFIGAVVIGVVNDGLDLLGISSFWQDIALGVILVLAVGLDVGLRHEAIFRLRRKSAALFGRKRAVGMRQAHTATGLTEAEVEFAEDEIAGETGDGSTLLAAHDPSKR